MSVTSSPAGLPEQYSTFILVLVGDFLTRSFSNSFLNSFIDVVVPPWRDFGLDYLPCLCGSFCAAATAFSFSDSSSCAVLVSPRRYALDLGVSLWGKGGCPPAPRTPGVLLTLALLSCRLCGEGIFDWGLMIGSLTGFVYGVLFISPALNFKDYFPLWILLFPLETFHDIASPPPLLAPPWSATGRSKD